MLTPIDWFLAAWLFALGAVVGSFLNVVVYRVPEGMSLVRPGSHCPACKRPIRWHDNVPIFGWLWLRGRCRDCGAWISPRYPVVEALTAVVFFVLAWAELFAEGANLPRRPILVGHEWLRPPWEQGELMGIYAFHLLLLLTLLSAALIEVDRKTAPLRLFAPALFVGFFAPLVWPRLHPVAVAPGWDGPIGGLLDGAAGLAAGTSAGAVAWGLGEIRKPKKVRAASSAAAPGLAAVGLFLGWQAALALGVLAGVGQWLQVGLRDSPEEEAAAGQAGGGAHQNRRSGILARLRAARFLFLPCVWLAVGTFAWILAWHGMIRRWPWLGFPDTWF